MHRVVDPADPLRCKGSAADGQCLNQAEPGSEFCKAHHGKDSGAAKRTYLLHKAKWRDRLAELSEHDNLKSLREEIAIVRMFLEERIGLIRNDNDLLSAFSAVQQATLTIERLTKTLHQMEQSLGSLLSKTTVMKLGQSISSIIVEELRDVPGYEGIVDRINDRIATAIVSAQNEEDE